MFVEVACYDGLIDERAAMRPTMFDPDLLAERGRLWRLEAEAATLEPMRKFCLGQADYCERLVRASMETPVLLEAPAEGGLHHGSSDEAGLLLTEPAPRQPFVDRRRR